MLNQYPHLKTLVAHIPSFRYRLQFFAKLVHKRQKLIQKLSKVITKKKTLWNFVSLRRAKKALGATLVNLDRAINQWLSRSYTYLAKVEVG